MGVETKPGKKGNSTRRHEKCTRPTRYYRGIMRAALTRTVRARAAAVGGGERRRGVSGDGAGLANKPDGPGPRCLPKDPVKKTLYAYGIVFHAIVGRRRPRRVDGSARSSREGGRVSGVKRAHVFEMYRSDTTAGHVCAKRDFPFNPVELVPGQMYISSRPHTNSHCSLRSGRWVPGAFPADRDAATVVAVIF